MGMDKVTTGHVMSLAALKAECMREKGRLLRIVVDAPFAVFQFKHATKQALEYGGMNHPTRTLFYHSLHLLQAGVQPVCIYDGPNKPPVKRGQQANSNRTRLTSHDFHLIVVVTGRKNANTMSDTSCTYPNNVCRFLEYCGVLRRQRLKPSA